MTKAERSRRHREERRKEAEAVGYTALTGAERQRRHRRALKDGQTSAPIGSDEFKAKLRARWTPEGRAAMAAAPR